MYLNLNLSLAKSIETLRSIYLAKSSINLSKYSLLNWLFISADLAERLMFYYEKELNIRTCAIKNLVEERSNCAEVDDVLVEETFNFKVTNTGNYVFKFWTGKDDEGNDTFMIYDIPVN